MPPNDDDDVPGFQGFMLAVGLAALAGWIDATGYLMYRGLFVSFMSGNSTRAAVGFGVDWSVTADAARAVLVFVVGVVAGELLGHSSRRWGRTWVLGFEAIMLGLAAVAWQKAQGEALVASLLGLAMGAQNASIHKVAGVSIALTYVTGTLVKIGSAIADALRGEGALRSVVPFVAVWVALVAGGLAGAMVTRHSVALSLHIAAGAAAVCTAWATVAAWRRFSLRERPV